MRSNRAGAANNIKHLESILGAFFVRKSYLRPNLRPRRLCGGRLNHPCRRPKPTRNTSYKQRKSTTGEQGGRLVIVALQGDRGPWPGSRRPLQPGMATAGRDKLVEWRGSVIESHVSTSRLKCSNLDSDRPGPATAWRKSMPNRVNICNH